MFNTYCLIINSVWSRKTFYGST